MPQIWKHKIDIHNFLNSISFKFREFKGNNFYLDEKTGEQGIKTCWDGWNPVILKIRDSEPSVSDEYCSND